MCSWETVDPEVMLRAVDVEQPTSGGIAARWRRKGQREHSDLLSGTWSYLTVLAWIILLGLTVRLPALVYHDFPVNDGGMFMQAIVELKNAHFALPVYLHYNGLQLPYAYPPLGFYIAGLVSSLTHMSVLNTLRVIPLFFSMATIVAFILFAQTYLQGRREVIVASTIAFALVPHSHTWEIMGGGLTRSVGFFFAVLTLWQVYQLFTQRSRSHLVWTIVFASLACLSHLELALFVAVSCAVMLFFHGRTRQGIRDGVMVAVGVLVVTSPWWAIIIERHGISPFISAGGTSGRSVIGIISLLIRYNWGGEIAFPIFLAFSMLALVYCVARRQYFLPVWVGAQLIADPRKFETETMVPMSIMVGICIVDFLIPAVTRVIESSTSSERRAGAEDAAPARPMSWLIPTAVGLVIFYGWATSLASTTLGLYTLSSSERQAMEWVRTSTAPDSTFAVLTGDAWGHDRSGEWFPVLADRPSIATVQGYEWIPNGAFTRQEKSYIALQGCVDQGPACIAQWSSDHHASFDYLYIGHRGTGSDDSQVPCCSALVDALKSDPAFTMVYQNADATIFRVHLSISQRDGPTG
jgi:hypothetical protein